MRNYSDYLTLEEEHEELSQICARQAVEIERLKCLLIHDADGQMVTQGAFNTLVCNRQWALDEALRRLADLATERALAAGSTIKHKATIERLYVALHEMRGLLETALDYFESAPGPHVSRSWLARVNEIVNGNEKGGDDG